MKQVLFLVVAFCNVLMINQLSAQCEPPTIVWDEDGLIINWIAQEDATSHELRYRETGTFLWTTVEIESNTFYDITFLDPCVPYDFRVRSVCGALESAYTPVYEARPNCGTCYDEGYCPIPLRSGNLSIEYFRIETVENTSTLDFSGYQDFRGNPEIILGPGQNAELEISIFEDNFDFNNTIIVAIDFNRNLEFEADEVVLMDTIAPGESIITTFDTPTDIDFGISRVRAVVTTFSQDPFSLCLDGFFGTGEVEEYCILLGEVPSLCDRDFNVTLDMVESGSATFSWEEVLTAAGYNFRYKKTSEDEWEELSTLEEEVVVGDLEDCTEYEFEIRAVCPSDTSSYKNNIVFDSFCPTSVEEENLTISAITTYPNPWSTKLNITLESKEATQAKILAYDLNGQQSITLNKFISSGTNEFVINEFANLTPGIYFIQVIDENGQSQTIKTLKIR